MTTLKDVAREAGLTVSTVSRVLNNRGYISEDARRRVDEAVRKLNYHPNEAARSLHNKRSNTIGVIVPNMRHPYFAEMISAMESQAYELGYKILLCNSRSIEAREKEFLEVCNTNRVAGIILLSGTVSVDDLRGTDLPVITLERYLDSGTAAVECDNRSGGELAANHLIDAGCRHLAIYGTTRNSFAMPADLRSDGFKAVCADRGVPCEEVFTDLEDFEKLEYYERLKSFLAGHPDVDGLLACSDVIAMQCIQACCALGINVPGQLKIIAFDDTMLPQWSQPQVTAIHQPIREMAQMAVTFLDDAVKGRMVPQRTVLPVRLEKRATT